MWLFKRKSAWRQRKSNRRRPYGEFSVGDVVVGVWLNESFSNVNRTRTRWGFSFSRKTKDRYVKSFRMRDLWHLEIAVHHLRQHLARNSSEPYDMDAFLENPGLPERLSR